MVSGSDIADRSPKYLGVPYSTMDCQKYVEKVLSDCGIKKDLAGSNAWYRFIMQNGWVGTPEECKDIFGEIPVGAFLFILENNGQEPEKYKEDRIGNASHIGIYTGMTGAKMVELARQMGNPDGAEYNFGNGAMNSSSSRGHVCTSKFSGKSISGGWNRIGLWNNIDYGINLNGGDESMEAYGKVVLPEGASGSTVNLREGPSKDDKIIEKVPVGSAIKILEDRGTWCKVCRVGGKEGWMMSNYIEYEGQGGESDGLTQDELKDLQKALTMIEDASDILTAIIGKRVAG